MAESANGVEQAFNILSAAHIESVIENRVLRAQLAQAQAKLAELEPNGTVVPLSKEPA